MKAYLEKLWKDNSYAKWLEWGKLVSLTAIAQVLVQAVGFVSGIIVIRLLPLEEYAFYTLANTILGTMTLLADGGISASVFAQSGKVWRDKLKLGTVINTGLKLRKRFAIISLILSFPLLFILLRHHGSSWLMTVMIALTLVPAFYANLSSSLFVIVPKIHQNISLILKNDLNVGIGRLLLTTIFIFIFPFTFIALLASGIPRIYGNYQLEKIASQHIIKQNADKKIEKKILKTVKRMYPGVVYYCFSGQIMLWIISFLGTTTSLAQLGALARIAIVLGLISKISQTLIIPRYAKLKEERGILLKYYIQIFLIFILVIAGCIGTGYLLADEILWVLGERYSGLQIELVLVLLGGGINLLSGTAFELNISREWIINPFFSIIISISTIILAAFFLDISKLKGVLIFNIVLALVQFLVNSGYGFFKVRNIESFPS